MEHEVPNHYTEYISGPISYYIVEGDNGVRFYLFGEIHRDYREKSCEQLYGWECDKENSKCITLPTLLRKWFNYNKSNKISTDFYLESPFTKEEGKRSELHFRNRENLLPEIYKQFRECFTMIKGNCVYNPEIRMHYADIRLVMKTFLDEDEESNFYYNVRSTIYYGILDITGYIYPMFDYIYDAKHSEFNINKIQEYFNESLLILQDVLIFLLTNQSSIIEDFYFNVQDIRDTLKKYEYLTELAKKNTSISYYVDNNINNIIRYSVERNGIRLTRTAAEYQRLNKINPYVSSQLRIFIKDITIINQLYLEDAITIIKSLIDSIINTNFNDTYTYLDAVDKMLIRVKRVFTDHKSSPVGLDMDIYTISRMFVQQYLNNTEQIISFAGYFHTKNYYDFLTEYLGYFSIYKYPHDRNYNKCVKNYIE